MTLLASRLASAGVDTAAARLNALAIEALRETGGNVDRAADRLWEKLQAESQLAKQSLLRPYLEARRADMAGGSAAVWPEATPLRPERKTMPPETRAKIDRVIIKAVRALKFGALTSDGRDWASVGVHELDGMERDGALASGIKERLGALNNKQRFMEIGELLSKPEFEIIKARCRGTA